MSFGLAVLTAHLGWLVATAWPQTSKLTTDGAESASTLKEMAATERERLRGHVGRIEELRNESRAKRAAESPGTVVRKQEFGSST